MAANYGCEQVNTSIESEATKDHQEDGENVAEQSAQATKQAVRQRLEGLRRGMESGSQYFDPFVTARAKEELRNAESRLNAGLGLTVVALVGGTGSGKSELFNAISGLNFAEVGDLRPTTTRASACVWNADADAVLDELGVDPRRRIRHESLLTGTDEDLDSLVLLDLPDHDSVALTNSAIVERTLPATDVVVWVLDPQKYADHLIHASYLAHMRARKDHMIVVLNQIDAVPASGVDVLISDIERLLVEDGLEGVPVYPVSARRRLGLEALHSELARAVSDTTSSLATAISELDAIAGRLLVGVGEGEADVTSCGAGIGTGGGGVGGADADAGGADASTSAGGSLNSPVDEIVKASGIPAVEESLRQAGRVFGKPALAKPEQPAASMIAATRDSWLAQARDGLPPMWRDGVTDSVTDAEKLRRAIATRVREVPVPQVKVWPRVVVSILGLLIGLGAIVVGALQVFSSKEAVNAGIALAGVAIGLGAYFGARFHKRRLGERAGDEYARAARGAVSDVVAAQLVEPVQHVLNQHRITREALSLS